jgi:hypothetical protein
MALTKLPGFTLDSTSSFTFANATITANVSAGNVKTDNLLYANGAAWSFGSTYSNANVATYLPTYTGNVSANYFIGNGSQLTGTIPTANYAAFAGNITIAAQPNITSVGSLSSLTVTGLVTATAGGVKVGNLQDASGTNTVQLTNSNMLVTGNITAGAGGSGNVTATYFIGNGSQLTGLPATYSNTNVAAYLLTNTSNVSANYFIGNGSLLTTITGGNVTGTVANATYATTAGTVTTAAQPNITSLGTLIDANISGNLLVSGNLTVNGTTEYTNVTNLYVKDPIIEMGGAANGGALSSNDGKDRGTLLHYYTTTPVDAFMGWDNSNTEFGFGSNVSIASEVITWNTYGNVRASYYLGNGSQLTGVAATTATTAATVTTNAQPNITSVGTLSSLTISGLLTTTAGGIKVGNIQDPSGTNTISLLNSNVSVTGNLSVGTGGTGNVTATYFIGNGSQLTGLPATYANANVANYLPTYTGNFSPSNLTVSTSANLGAVSNVIITGGSANYVLTTDGAGSLSWAAQTGGGSTPPASPIAKVDVFTATGTGNTYTLSSTPANEDQLSVNIDGVMQLHSSFSLSGNVVTLDGTPVSGAKVEITNIASNIGATTGKAIAMAIVFGF